MKTVELTEPQIMACLAALGSYLVTGTDGECTTVFGSGQGTKAAERAQQTLAEQVDWDRLTAKRMKDG